MVEDAFDPKSQPELQCTKVQKMNLFCPPSHLAKKKLLIRSFTVLIDLD